jgi:hypothetical protein
MAIPLLMDGYPKTVGRCKKGVLKGRPESTFKGVDLESESQ